MRLSYIQDGCAFFCRDAPHKIIELLPRGGRVEELAAIIRYAIRVAYGREAQGSEGMHLAGAVRCTFFRRACTENVAETETHCDVPLDMLHVPRSGAFGIVFALLWVSDPAEDGAPCSVGEVNHGTCADY